MKHMQHTCKPLSPKRITILAKKFGISGIPYTDDYVKTYPITEYCDTYVHPEDSEPNSELINNICSAFPSIEYEVHHSETKITQTHTMTYPRTRHSYTNNTDHIEDTPYYWKTESTHIRELRTVPSKENDIILHNYFRDLYHDKFPRGRDTPISGGIHLHLHMQENTAMFFEQGTYPNIAIVKTPEISTNIGKLLCQFPFRMKIGRSLQNHDYYFFAREGGHKQRGANINPYAIDGGGGTFFSSCRVKTKHNYAHNSIEFRCNNVMDKRIMRFYQFILIHALDPHTVIPDDVFANGYITNPSVQKNMCAQGITLNIRQQSSTTAYTLQDIYNRVPDTIVQMKHTHFHTLVHIIDTREQKQFGTRWFQEYIDQLPRIDTTVKTTAQTITHDIAQLQQQSCTTERQLQLTHNNIMGSTYAQTLPTPIPSCVESS